MAKIISCGLKVWPGPAICLVFLLSLSLSTLQAQTYFKADPDGFRFGNGYLERVFERRGDSWRTTWLVNKLSGHTWRVDSQEFRIRFTFERLGYWPGLENPIVVGAEDCLFRGYRIEEPENGQRRLVLLYHWEQGLFGERHSSDRQSPGLEIQVTYTLGDNLPFMHKQVRLSCEGGKLYFVEELSLEHMEVAGADIIHQGFGQPVYTEEMFFGLEYPAGNNMVGQGRLTLYYYPGTAVDRRGYESYRSVWGVARRERTRAAFLDYIERIRVAPARPFLLYNTWYDLRTAERADGSRGGLLNLENSLLRVQSFKESLVDHGIELHSFVLDEGWDRYTPYWEIDKKNFTGGFTELSRALKGIGCGLGLWFGPIGGYGEGLRLRGSRGRKAGLEVSHKGYLDLAGPKYNRIFKERLLEYIKRYDVNYFKFDGVLYGYADTDHGMLPGIYSREAHTSSLISLLDTLYAARPGIFTNITTSQWLSPWWLMHTDCVFMGGGDYGWLRTLPSPSKRDLAISYRDKVCYDQFVRYNQQFPTNSIMTVGVIKGEYELLGALDETLDKWTNNLVMHFSRGLSMWELYISPQILKQQEWETLRESIRWATENKDVLFANTTLVGGDPARREPYGYFHQGEQKMILTVRNPYIEPALFRVKLDYDSGWLAPDRQAYLPVTVYPYKAVEGPWLSYGEQFEVPLNGYETKVIELVRRDLVNLPVLLKTRFDFEGENLVIYPEPGEQTVTVENCTADELTLSGVSIPPGTQAELPLGSVTRTGSLEVQDSRNITWKTGESSGLSGEIFLRLPEETLTAEIAFLVELDGEIEKLQAVITRNGQALECRTEAGEQNNWSWFVARLGRETGHRIGYEFNSEGWGKPGGVLSAWLIIHRELEGHTSRAPERVAGLAGRFLLPADSSIRREVECLFKRPLRF